MFPGNIEDMAFERQKEFLQEADQRRLIEALRNRRHRDRRLSGRVSGWVGARLVTWGLKLQGHQLGPSSQVAVVGGAEVSRSRH